MIEIDGYADIERIGRGGLGDVYRATQRSTGGTVAIKVLRDVSDESVAWHRTRRELTALVSLAGHANVIQLSEVLDLPDGPALVMEYAPGGSIADLMLRRDGPLSVGEVALVGRQTASALVAAHARGIVHRDVKPQNLLIDAYGQVKLCDFGIAAMARSEEFQARTSAISMRYASPEDLDDEVDVGPASDIYSLGATLLHLARGAPPTLKERLAPWQPPATDDPQLAALDEIVAACLQPSPSARPSAAQVEDELERLGWAIDERNRSIAFDAVDLAAAEAGLAGAEAATVPRPGRGDGADEGDIGDASTDRGTEPPSGRDASTVPRPRAPAEDRPSGPVGRAVAALDHDRELTSPAAGPVEESPDDPSQVDETVYRDDRRPSQPVAPERRRRRWPFVVGVAVVVAVVAVVFWPGGGDGPTIELVDRPSGLADVRDLVWPIGDVGECLVQRDETLEPVACSEAHDLQRFAVGELDDAVVPATFDAGAVEAAARSSCNSAFNAFVGVDPGSSELEVAIGAPSSATWAEGDRTFQCLLGVAGQRVVGDAEGSAHSTG